MSGLGSSSRPPGPPWTHSGTSPGERVSDCIQQDKHQADSVRQPSGAFTDYCSPCYIINKGERNQEVAHLVCDCAPDDSDVSTEYSFDLGTSRSLCHCKFGHMQLDPD